MDVSHFLYMARYQYQQGRSRCLLSSHYEHVIDHFTLGFITHIGMAVILILQGSIIADTGPVTAK